MSELYPSYFYKPPNKEIQCLISPAGDMSKKIWALWQPEHEAFLNARGDLIELDETLKHQQVRHRKCSGVDEREAHGHERTADPHR